MDTSNKFEKIKDWLFRYSKIIMPVVLVVCVVVTVIIAINANGRKATEDESVDAAEEVTIADVPAVVPEVPMELNAVPEVNDLINTYYGAMVEGDTDTMSQLMYKLDETEILKARETSKYIESYPVMEIYTKAGPKENTYLAYVYYEVKFHDYDKPIPGMSTYYVCMDEDGNYYLNEDGEEEDNVIKYIKEVTLQDDVVDLNNKVAVAYNDMVNDDEELRAFIIDLDTEIGKNVGEALAREEGSESSSEEGETDGGEQQSGELAETEEPAAVVTKVKATDVVNIRTSDSETADKLGKAAIGDEFTLLEERANGWSKISYEGRDAFIKSEYLEPSETKEANAGDTNTEPETQTTQTTQTTTQTDNNNSPASGGTVTVKENVRIRASASEDAEKLGTAYVGEKLEVIMKQADGWTKIKYNGKTAYVKSDYVE